MANPQAIELIARHLQHNGQIRTVHTDRFCILRELIPGKVFYIQLRNGWKFTARVFSESVFFLPGLQKQKKKR